MRWVPRSVWGARPARSSTPLDQAGMRGFAVHWEGPRMGLFAHTDCPSKARGIQRFHMVSRGWADIAYSFLVCPHGFVFEGRGWVNRPAAQGTDAGNARYWAACYLSGEGDPLTDAAKAAYDDLFAEGLSRAPRATEVRPHSSFKPTACPGDDLRAWIAARGQAPATPEEALMARYPQIVAMCKTPLGVVGIDKDGNAYANPPAAYKGGVPSLEPRFRLGERGFVDVEANDREGYDMLADDLTVFSFPFKP